MRYIGGKSKILPYLEGFLLEKLDSNHPRQLTFLDLFSGTGVVAKHFKNRFKVITNDNMYYSYILSRGSVTPNTPPLFSSLSDIGILDPVHHLGNLDGVRGFISEHYASEEDASPSNQRMYFTMKNAMRIDAIRQQINTWLNDNAINQDEFDYLLAILIEAIPFISNTTGTYGAYLKKWDARALKDLKLVNPILYDNNQENLAFNQTAELLTQSITSDICYIDPPYNNRQYSSNYHLLETIAKYDSPNIRGVTGIREFEEGQVSNFCKKLKVLDAFEQVITQVDCKHLIVSYSSDGLLSVQKLKQLMMRNGKPETFDLKVIDYDTYKSKIVLRPKVDEYLLYIEKA